MSILIKGMEMPRTCIECPLQFGGMCYVQPPEIDQPRVAPTVEECTSRTDWCPLIEVPEHGRLIDADVFERNLIPMQNARNQNNLVARGIRKARGVARDLPTVIPADKDGET